MRAEEEEGASPPPASSVTAHGALGDSRVVFWGPLNCVVSWGDGAARGSSSPLSLSPALGVPLTRSCSSISPLVNGPWEQTSSSLLPFFLFKKIYTICKGRLPFTVITEHRLL